MNQDITVIFTVDGFLIDAIPTKSKRYYYDQNLMKGFAKNKYLTLLEFGFMEMNIDFSASLTFLYNFSKKFIDSLSKDGDIEITRRAKSVDNETALDILHNVPYAIGIEYVNILWLKQLWVKLSEAFYMEIQEYDGTVAEYLHSKSSEINVVGRVFFHLVENKDEAFPFAFLATYSTGTREKVNHLPLKSALIEYKNEPDKLLSLLSTVSRATDQSEFISELVESGELFSPLKFNSTEAYTLLKEIPFYEECGIVCRIPDWWKRKGNARVSVSVGGKEPSMLGMDTIVSFNPNIYLGDMQMTKEEIEGLLSQTEGLSYIKGKWVEVNHDKLRMALDAFHKAEDMDGMTFAEAMRMQLNINNVLQDEGTTLEITNGQWLNSLKNRLTSPSKIENISLGGDFKADLRHYQQTGVNWLTLMKKLGFGALLADDMGLGKTIQILALLEYLRQHGGVKALLVIPASLLFNWQNEADRFTPKLKYTVIHSDNRDFNLSDADLFITTYGFAMRLEEFKAVKWDVIILDEAQAIKNAGTKQTKAIKELKATSKIAMTGTPIENRLSDLWSIFDFLNQGMLGTAKEFGDFSKGLKEDMVGYSRLRDIVNPFILRRLKTDRNVISDLPDKIDVKAFTVLTKKQVVLYKALVKELEAALENVDGMERKGLVLASIMKFKQICNHPDQYLGLSEFASKNSGKFEKLAEICETIFEKRERVLVFTQFKEMTEPIAKYLETAFGRKGLVLHGGTQVKKRGKLVETFNGEEYVPFMVLSVKAGGVGLNLTVANHVVHFDRWWNPAVENQATDRAFRIGQRKNVTVHKFVTVGTIEEKIDQMLEEKQKLADDVIMGSGEKWITELENKELMKLFQLG